MRVALHEAEGPGRSAPSSVIASYPERTGLFGGPRLFAACAFFWAVLLLGIFAGFYVGVCG